MADQQAPRPYSATEKLGCIERELRMRRSVYPKWVQAGRLTQERANEELRIMQAIAEDYRTQAQSERLL